jgi:hypothetical protein
MSPCEKAVEGSKPGGNSVSGCRGGLDLSDGDRVLVDRILEAGSHAWAEHPCSSSQTNYLKDSWNGEIKTDASASLSVCDEHGSSV